jgi:uncharacterized protein YaaR (DUF327 family)
MPEFLESIKKSRKASGLNAEKKPVIKETENPEGDQFHNVLAGVQNVDVEKRLGKILKDIQRLSGLLSKRRLLEDLEEYRNRVGEFLKVFMDEALIVREASGGRKGLRRKQLIVVKRVDIELEELSRLVLGGAPDFKIIKELGTIEGLLLDLYR